MSEKETLSEVAEVAENGNTIPDQKKEDVLQENKEERTTTPERKVEDVLQKKEEEKDVVEEMEDGKHDDEVERQKFDADPVGQEINEENKKEENGSKEEEERKGCGTDAMEEKTETKETEESEEKADELKEIEERAEKSKQKKTSKKHGKGKTTVTRKKPPKGTEEEKNKEGEESKGDEEENKKITDSEALEDEMEVTETEDIKDNVEEKIDGLNKEEGPKKSKQKKGSKTHGKNETEVVKEHKTPMASASDRPAREKKSVKRLVASDEMESFREVHIEKGRGTALNDIPNVAYQLSKRKTDDIIKSLHMILFGRRGKAFQFKSNISQFSGFVWNENEEKQKLKVQEKIDKYVKEKLMEICDVLDIPIAKSTTKKEDIVTKLIDFLLSPHATTTELLSEKGQSSKGKKRKRGDKRTASMSDNTSSKHSAKSRTEDDSDEEEVEHEEELTASGIPEKSKTEIPDSSESQDSKAKFEDESEEDVVKDERDSKKSFTKKESSKSSTKKESSKKEKTKKLGTADKASPLSLVIPERSKNEVPDDSESNDNIDEFEDDSEEGTVKDKRGSKTKRTTIPKKASPLTKGAPVKSSSNHSKADDESDASPNTLSRKKKRTHVKSSSNHSKVDDEIDKGPKTLSKRKKTESIKEKSSTPKSPVSKEKTGEKVTKRKDKPKGAKLRPSDDELRNAICDILKKVDFNTATFTDILKQIAGRFKMDLTATKSSIKLMIEDELTKLAYETDDHEDECDAEKDDPKHSFNNVEVRLP